MKKPDKTKRTCKQGHIYYKSTDCPTCPVCEAEKNKKAKGFMSELSAPARRALENAKITTLKKLADKTEKEILSLHGMGPSSIPLLRKALGSEGLNFKEVK